MRPDSPLIASGRQLRALDLAQIRQRFDSLSWWRERMREHPGGIVPLNVAARMLGVTGRRLRVLERLGRLSTIRGMPGSLKGDRFVAVDELLRAPFRLNRGQPGRFGVARVKNFSSDGRGGKCLS
jgi:hypothetical protein